MNVDAGSDTGMSKVTVIGTIAFLASSLLFAYLAYTGVSRTGLMAPAVLGWISGLIMMRTLVDADKHTVLYFAFSVLAVMIFFIHETYGYTGKVRNFPLIIGYTGVVICVLDILSLSNRIIGDTITRIFGSQLDEKEIGGRSVKRELIAFAAMGGCVLGIWLFGFLAFSPLFVAAWMLAGRKTVKNALYGGTFTLLAIYLMFELAFQYELYRGILFIWLLDL